MIKRFLWSWLGNALGLFAAAVLFSGINFNNLYALIIASFIFGIVNAFIKPFVVILSLPAIVFTLGLFTLVINGLMLWLTSLIYPAFHVSNLWVAIAAVVIVWLINYLIDIFILKEQHA